MPALLEPVAAALSRAAALREAALVPSTSAELPEEWDEEEDGEWEPPLIDGGDGAAIGGETATSSRRLSLANSFPCPILRHKAPYSAVKPLQQHLIVSVRLSSTNRPVALHRLLPEAEPIQALRLPAGRAQAAATDGDLFSADGSSSGNNSVHVDHRQCTLMLSLCFSRCSGGAFGSLHCSKLCLWGVGATRRAGCPPDTARRLAGR